MRILELCNVERAPGEIYYRRKFKAVAKVEIPIKTLEVPVQFIIETNAFGGKDLDIDFLSTPDYPLVPIKEALIKLILSLDSEGKI